LSEDISLSSLTLLNQKTKTKPQPLALGDGTQSSQFQFLPDCLRHGNLRLHLCLYVVIVSVEACGYTRQSIHSLFLLTGISI